MMINKSTVGDVTIVAPEGMIDTDTSRILKEELNGLIDTGRTAVLVDFSGVDFMTSTGLSAMLYAAKRVEEVTGKFAVCSVNKDIHTVFAMTGFDSILDIYPTVDEALEKLQ